VSSDLTIATNARLDLKNDLLIVAHTDNDGGVAKYNFVRNKVIQGLNIATGYWDGNGITSSTAANDPNALTAVAVVNNDDGGGGAFFDSFGGKSVTNKTILARYTYWGDANLDGVINADDYALTDSGYFSNIVDGGWLFGDFNYDGVVNADDYALLDSAYFANGAPLSAGGLAPLSGGSASPSAGLAAGGTSAVPEPASLALVGIGAAGMLLRRKKRKA